MLPFSQTTIGNTLHVLNTKIEEEDFKNFEEYDRSNPTAAKQTGSNHDHRTQARKR
jgi:hypothetical protein